MLIQKITWGLWNQMFQYAYVKALSLKNKVDFNLDISWYKNYFRPYELEIFAVEKKYATSKDIPWYERITIRFSIFNFIYSKIKERLKRLNPDHYTEKSLLRDSNFMQIKSGYIEGYFQSEKYFKKYKTKIRSDFSFILPISHQSTEILKKIQSTNSVSLHIRRGDYLKGDNINYHGICPIDYYHQAISYLKSKEENLTFFFFSDDIGRVKENFKIKNKYFIDRNKGKDSRQDMKLMSECKHNIIANSSFSRWGAWLNANPSKIVIAPKQRFANEELESLDIIPDNWIKL